MGGGGVTVGKGWGTVGKEWTAVGKEWTVSVCGVTRYMRSE